MRSGQLVRRRLSPILFLFISSNTKPSIILSIVVCIACLKVWFGVNVLLSSGAFVFGDVRLFSFRSHVKNHFVISWRSYV